MTTQPQSSTQSKVTLHEKRWRKNLGVLILLVMLVFLFYALVVVKIKHGGSWQGFDHRPQNSQPIQRSNP